MNIRYFVTVDAGGFLTGSYPSDVAPAPGGALELTFDQWADLLGNQGARRWDGTKVVDYTPPPPPPPTTPPDNPTLSDYRVALTLWGRIDDVTGRIATLVASSDPKQAMLGKIAKERFEYANNVLKTQLVALKDALGFTEADVDESLWRAGQVAKGDLSGVWPLPAS